MAFSKLVEGEGGEGEEEEENVTTYKILGSLKILAIKNNNNKATFTMKTF